MGKIRASGSRKHATPLLQLGALAVLGRDPSPGSDRFTGIGRHLPTLGVRVRRARNPGYELETAPEQSRQEGSADTKGQRHGPPPVLPISRHESILHQDPGHATSGNGFTGPGG
jgi:hypothetical protein